MEFKAAFKIERATKNTIRYMEQPQDGQSPRIGTLYIQKWALGTPPPQTIEVTVRGK